MVARCDYRDNHIPDVQSEIVWRKSASLPVEQLRRRDSDVSESPEIPIPRPPEATRTPRDLTAQDHPEPCPTETSETPNTSPSRLSSAGKVYLLRRNPKPIERYAPSWT